MPVKRVSKFMIRLFLLRNIFKEERINQMKISAARKLRKGQPFLHKSMRRHSNTKDWLMKSPTRSTKIKRCSHLCRLRRNTEGDKKNCLN
jgi:hypothetical protein